MIEKCYEKAKEVIRGCSTNYGLFASGGKEGYNAIWARDSMISLIGAGSADVSFKNVFKQSLILLGKYQSRNGQIPNCVDKFSSRKKHVDFASIDSSLWYIIGHFTYRKRYNDNSIFDKNKIEKAFCWLQCQDFGEKVMLTQLPTTDWQDAFPHKYGYAISTQALYYKVLNLMGKVKDARRLKFMVNENEDTKLWKDEFYLAYRWKNHNKYKEIGDWFDSFGNVLAIVFDLADKQKARKIISYIEKRKINMPYAMKAIYPPIKKGSKDWHDYFEDCDARKPYNYLNGGIWTFIGGFYVLSLIKLGKFEKAKRELEKLAKANLKGNFPEWVNPLTKKSYGKYQAWSAGMYILAYESFKKRKVLI